MLKKGHNISMVPSTAANKKRRGVFEFCGVILLVCFFTSGSAFAEEMLTWQQCINEARKAHPDLYAAQALMQQTDADERIAASARSPQLSLSVSSQESFMTAKNNGSRLSSAHSYSLSAQQLLYDGNKTSSQIASAKEAVKGAQNNYNVVAADLRFALRTAFTQLLKAQELVGLAGEIAERRQNNVRLISLRYRGGREPLGSLRQSEADLAEAEFDVSQAKRGLVLAQTLLASALGRDTHKPLRVQGAFKVADLSVTKPDLALLVKNNPLFQQLDTKSKAARFDLDAARSAFSPELYLTSSIGNGSVDSLPFNNLDANAGFTVSVPIYEGGAGRVRVIKAMAVLSQHNAEEKIGYLQLFNALEESWKSYQDARQMVVVKRKFLDAALERSTIANAQYSNGLISFDDWVIIENNLVSAKKEFLNAGADMLIAEAQWIQAKGEGFDG